MRHWKPITGILLVFLLGASAGSLGTHIVYQRRIEGIFQRGPHAVNDAIREIIVKDMSKRLDLDSIQRVQLQQIVTDLQRDLMKLRKVILPQIDAIIGQMEGKVRAILRPEQLTTFESFALERRMIWNEEQSKAR